MHHLAVERDGRDRGRRSPRPTSSGTRAQGPVAVLRQRRAARRRARASPATPAASRRWRRRSLAGGLDAIVIAGFVARLNDALAAAASSQLGRGGPRRAAGALRLARARVRGADGADAPHRPGQRARLRGRGRRAARLVPGARRARERRPRGGGLPALPRRAHGARVARHAVGVGASDSTAASRAAPHDAAIFFDLPPRRRRARPRAARAAALARRRAKRRSSCASSRSAALEFAPAERSCCGSAATRRRST